MQNETENEEAPNVTNDDADYPTPDEEREKVSNWLREAGILTKRFIDVKNGEKGTRTPGHQQPENWLEADDPRLSGNYGIHPGHGLIEFDVDDYDGDHNTEALDALPETLTGKSPHTDDDDPGHWYYAVKDDEAVKAVLRDVAGTLNPEPTWGEIKYEGKYVVGPGSQLDGCSKEWCDECDEPDGGYYRIVEDRLIATLTAEDIADVLRADPEFAMADGNRPATEVFDLPPEDDSTDGKGETETEGDEWVTEDIATNALTHIDPTVDNDRWVRIGYALGGCFDDETARSLFTEWSKGDLSEDHSGAKWDDEAKKRAPDIIDRAEPGGSATIATVVELAKHGGWDASAAARTATATDGGAVTATTTAIDSPTPDTEADEWKEVRALFNSSQDNSTTRGYNKAVDALEAEGHHFVAIRETNELYYYDPNHGHYVRKGRTYIKELLQNHIPGYANTNRVRNIYENVKARNYTAAREFTPPEGKVCVRNGVLDLDTCSLEPPSPEYYFTAPVQTEYDPDADAERWVEFLGESVSEDAVKKLEEFIGYTLETWHHDREKNLFIVGPRQSGKSTFADTVTALFGSMPTVTALTPQQIADTRFAAANLKEAALNTVNDINASKIEDTGTLKRVFSGEPTKFERKGQDEEFGKPAAKHLYTANWLPRVATEDESLYRRVLIVEFPNKVDDEDRDLDLKDELPGILNRALDARDRLYEQDGFTADRSDTETRQKWDSWRDAHKRFLYTQYEITGDPTDTVDKETYYQAYKEYSGRKGYELKAKQSVTKSLEWVPEVEVKDDEYVGIRWRDTDAAESQDDNTDRPQGELVTKVTHWVEAFATPVAPAEREEILDHAERQEYNPERVSDMINTMCDEGKLWKPEAGGLRPT